jgi:D-glycero-D-manno-heptose 1,7-bisphosphate phosphatase
MRPAAFIDRDGVINRELHHVYRVEDFHVLPGVVEGLRSLAAAGYRLVVVTNQGGIAKGLYSQDDYQHLTQHMRQWFAARGVEFAGVYHCPHHPGGSVMPWAQACTCRKPEPGLLLQAASELDLDLARSVMVGDKVSDVQAAQRVGVGRLVLVESGHALPAGASEQAHYRCAGLAEAAQWITTTPVPACRAFEHSS